MRHTRFLNVWYACAHAHTASEDFAKRVRIARGGGILDLLEVLEGNIQASTCTSIGATPARFDFDVLVDFATAARTILATEMTFPATDTALARAGRIRLCAHKRCLFLEKLAKFAWSEFGMDVCGYPEEMRWVTANGKVIVLFAIYCRRAGLDGEVWVDRRELGDGATTEISKSLFLLLYLARCGLHLLRRVSSDDLSLSAGQRLEEELLQE
jgi:hypothetical protein